MTLLEMSAVLEANHGPTIYDRTFSNPEAEQPSYEDFEAIVARIAGEITEGSAQVRKDNPFRKKSVEGSALAGGSGGIADQLKYERIFSDTSQSESDDSFIQNVKPVTSRRVSLGAGGGSGGQHGKKSRPNNKDISSKAKPPPSLSAGKKSAKQPKAGIKSKSAVSVTVFPTDSSMSSSEEEAELKKLSPRKDFSKAASGRNSVATVNSAAPGKLDNIYSDSDSDHEMSAAAGMKAGAADNLAGSSSSRGRRPGKKSGKSERKKTESSSAEGLRDSEDTQHSLDRPPRSPVFRTKAAMKEFSLEDLHRAQELAKNGGSSSRPTAAVSPSKEVVASKQSKQEGKQSRRRVLSPAAEAVDSEMVAGTEDDELVFGPPIILVPERSAARKANQRLKFPATDDKTKKTASEPLMLNDASTVAAESNNRKKIGGNKMTAASAGLFGDSDSDDTVAVVAAATRGRSRSPTKTAVASSGREVRKSPRGAQHGAAATLVLPPSDSDLSDLEVAAKKSPGVSVVKQPAKKPVKTVYDKAATAGGQPQRSSLAFSDDEDGEISFLPAKEKLTKAVSSSGLSSSATRLNNRNNKALKSPLSGEMEFDSLLPLEPKAPSDSESDAEFRWDRQCFKYWQYLTGTIYRSRYR